MSRKHFFVLLSIIALLCSMGGAADMFTFNENLRTLYCNKEYDSIISESQNFIARLSEEQINDHIISKSLSVRDILFDVLYTSDIDKEVRIKSIEMIADICNMIYSYRFYEEKSSITFGNILGRIRDIEFLVGIGRIEKVCELLHKLDRHVDNATFDEYVLNKSHDGPLSDYEISRIITGTHSLLLFQILPLFCDEEIDIEERNDKIVQLIAQHNEASWMPKVIFDLCCSPMWGNTFFLLPSKQLNEYYSFLCAVEPLVRNHSNEDHWPKSFYSRLVKVTSALERHGDMVKWWNIQLARADTDHDAFVARSELSTALRKLRENQGTPQIHEEDIKMMEELGLFE